MGSSAASGSSRMSSRGRLASASGERELRTAGRRRACPPSCFSGMPRSASRARANGGVEAPVQVPGQVQHVPGGQVLVDRRVLRDERDAVRARRASPPGARRGRSRSPRSATVRPAVMFISVDLPAPFGPTSAARCPAGTAQRAVPQRPRLAVALAKRRWSRSRSCDALRSAGPLAPASSDAARRGS